MKPGRVHRRIRTGWIMYSAGRYAFNISNRDGQGINLMQIWPDGRSRFSKLD